VAVVLYLLYLVKDIVFLLFIALILSALIDPAADKLQAKKIPRTVTVILIYVFLFLVIGVSLYLIVPIITHDLPQLIDNLGKIWINLQGNDFWNKIVEGSRALQSSLANYGMDIDSGTSVSQTTVGTISGVFSTITGFFGGLFSLVLVLIMALYMVVQKKELKKEFFSIIPEAYREKIASTSDRIRDKLGAWLRGQLIVSLVVGLLVYLGLSLAGVNYAGILALMAGLLEFIPYVGPVFASLPALFLAFSQGGILKVLLVVLVYFIIHELEANLLIPKVMQRAIGLNPIISIVAILVGAELAGVVGAIVAIPVASALSVMLQDVLNK